MKHHIALDLDGTVLDYYGWGKGKAGDGGFEDPLPGALEFINELMNRGHKVTIFTAREDHQGVSDFLASKGFPRLAVTSTKLPHFTVIIDDRNLPFQPVIYSDKTKYITYIESFEPWWKNRDRK